MCGITGFFDHNDSVTEIDLQHASNALAHRGGNGKGLIFEKKNHYTVGLANERLATIDLSENGMQPFTSTCGNYSITFNGTIYNYIELRQELIKYGVTFLTLSDTEVLLEGYKKWGFGIFEKIDGAFAFAILDRIQNQFFIARDSIGVKPLYYYASDSFFAFSSEIRGLLKYPLVEKNINRQALLGYLRQGYFSGVETIFEGIYHFKKQHALTIDLNSGNSYERRFGVKSEFNLLPTDDEEKTLQHVEELLTDSILKRSIADASVGVLLNNGYDSAIIAAILQKNQTKRIKTFTLGFEKGTVKEVSQANKIANYLKTNHKEYLLGKNEAIEMLEMLPEIFDEPIGDSSVIPLAYVASKINSDVKIILGAEGGDELFGGYSTYKRAIKLNTIVQKIPDFLKPFISRFFSDHKKANEILTSAHLLDTYTSLTAYFSDLELAQILGEKSVSSAGKDDNLRSLLAYDLENYLPKSLLLKAERSYMHFGIDNRDAMLKNDLVNYAKSVDQKWLIRNGNTKYLLKQIAHKYLPEELLSKSKAGFKIPLAKWLKTHFRPYVEEYLSAVQLNKHQLFNVTAVLKLKNDFYQHNKTVNAKKIWLLLQFQMWYNKWGY